MGGRRDIPWLILGLGNELCRDDGAGVRAARLLRARPPAGAVVVEVGTAVLDALPWIARAERVLLLDAVAYGGAPGVLCALDGADAATGDAAGSLHALDVMSAFRRLMPDFEAPPFVVLGVQPASMEIGLELSPAVAAALPALAEAARRLVAGVPVEQLEECA